MKNMKKRVKLIENRDYNEAYQFFEEKYRKNHRDLMAFYYMTVVKFLYLEYNIDEIITDLEYLLKASPKTIEPVTIYLAIAYDYKMDSQKAIKMAKKALNFANSPKLDLTFSIARHLFVLGEEENLLEALTYVDKCIELDEYQTIDYFFLKADIFISLNRKEELDNLLNEILFKFNNHPGIYYYRAKGRFEMAKTKEDYEKALVYYQDYQKYEPNDDSILLNLYLIYKNTENYQEASKILDKFATMKESFDEETILTEKIHLKLLADETEEMKMIADAYLKDHPNSLTINQTIARAICDEYNDPPYIEDALPYFEKAYLIEPSADTLEDLYLANKKLKLLRKNLELVTDYLKHNPNSGYGHHLLIDTYLDNNFPYDEIEKVILKTGKLKYYNRFSFVDQILSVTKNPKKYQNQISLALNVKPEKLNYWFRRKMGIRALYGLNISKPYFKKAYDFIDECLEEDMDVSCTFECLGRYYEIAKKEYDKAYEAYNEAYKIYEVNDSFYKCHCAIGYLAHAYLQGIGVKKDLEKAKELIVDAIEFHESYAHSSVIYLYAYLYLKGEVEADGRKIIAYLRQTSKFLRYEISKEVLISQINQKLGLPDKDAKKKIKKAYKYDSILARKYYKLHKNDPVYYPFLNNI